MSGVRRFLSRRDKSPHQHHRRRNNASSNKQPDHFGGVFALTADQQKKQDKDTEKKVKGVIERLRYYGIDNMVESNVEYALHASSPQGDAQAAFQLLMLLEDTYEGLVQPYSPDIKMLGAVNRQSVTCYLDALLFAMFARLDGFEAMLYDSFDDAKRKRLAGLLRLWVNMLRTGRLITIDIAEHIQNALSELGWKDASKLQQQDPSEAFTFITGQLELPMLTLKMDMFHTGKEDPQDDHKFVNERLLEVALLDAPLEGNSVITLEDCLEYYFNNRIEVKRHLENQRRNTLKSIHSVHSATKFEKESGTHVEVVDLGDSPDTPVAHTPIVQSPVQTPIHETPAPSKSPMDKLRPTAGRKRTDSIFSQRTTELTGIDPEALKAEDPSATQDAKGRKLSTRTEVLMPAWQFFKLLPWYADNMPTTDAQVAAHFAKKRPVLGICLKRYSYTNTGQARKLDTYVDIPLEIAVPNFVGDDSMHEDGPLVGNFRLMLQSVVCHRGVSVNSGHYVCLCRGRRSHVQRPPSAEEKQDGEEGEDFDDPWMRFDDLAKERVSYVNIREALKQEMPYLLFYQVLPIGEDGHSIHDLPSYAEATSTSESDVTIVEKPYLSDRPGSGYALDKIASEPNAVTRPSTDRSTSSTRNSFDAVRFLDSSANRRSIAIDNPSLSVRPPPAPPPADTSSGPTTPSDEKASSLLSVANKISASRRGSRVSNASANEKGRSPSAGPDNRSGSTGSSGRFALNITKLTNRISRLDPDDAAARADLDENEVTVTALPVPSRDSTGPSYVPAASPVPGVAAQVNVAKPRKDKERRRLGTGSGSTGGKHEDRDCVLM